MGMKRQLFAAMLGLLVGIAGGTSAGATGRFLANGPLPPVPIPADNPQTDAKVRLGQQLYFDGRLSGDGTISCSSCHGPETGWANHGKTDVGIRKQVGGRNSGTVLNSAYMKFQFWDGRAGSLEEQALGPIQNPIEHGETLENVIRKLNAVPGYRSQFQAVFGTDATAEGIAKAIAAFERSILTGPAPYDRWLAGDRSAMSASAVRGMNLFNGKAHCTPCHSGPTFSDQSFHNLGVGMEKPNPDLGREAHTKSALDRGRFKTPGLRNVALTQPYLHDGSAATLMDVVDLYDRGGAPNPDLDRLVLPLGLTASEKSDLVAFLEALTGTLPQLTRVPLPSDANPPAAAGQGGGR